MVNYFSPEFSAHLSEFVEPIRELSKEKALFNLEPRTSRDIPINEKRNCSCTNLGLLKSKETDCLANRHKHQRIVSMLATRPQTSIFCQQGINRGAERVCSNRIRVPGLWLGQWKNSTTFYMHKSFYSRDRSEASGIHLVKKHQSNHPKIWKVPDKNLSLSCILWDTLMDLPTKWLIACLDWEDKKIPSSFQNFISTRSQAN